MSYTVCTVVAKCVTINSMSENAYLEHEHLKPLCVIKVGDIS